MSTFVQFVPSTLAPFTFQATLLNGQQYNVVVTWNTFEERYYINVYDIGGNRIVTRGLVPCGPLMDATFTWAAGVATAACVSPHLVPIGDPVNIRVTDTDTGFDGTFQALATDPLTLTYQLPINPLQPASINGTVNFDLDLLVGYGIGSLFYHQDTQQFEF